jgi:hypothetical protein
MRSGQVDDLLGGHGHAGPPQADPRGGSPSGASTPDSAALAVAFAFGSRRIVRSHRSQRRLYAGPNVHFGLGLHCVRAGLKLLHEFDCRALAGSARRTLWGARSLPGL